MYRLKIFSEEYRAICKLYYLLLEEEGNYLIKFNSIPRSCSLECNLNKSLYWALSSSSLASVVVSERIVEIREGLRLISSSCVANSVVGGSQIALANICVARTLSILSALILNGEY